MLGVVVTAVGVASFAVDGSSLGLVAGIVGAIAAAIVAGSQVRARSTERALESARMHARRLRRQLEQVLASVAEEESSKPELAGGGDHATVDAGPWDGEAASGMLREGHLSVLLRQTVAAARRKVLPVSVVLWELDGLDGAGHEARHQAVLALGDVAFAALRESDALFRSGDLGAVAVLTDTAEPGAVMVAQRVRTLLRSSPVGDAITVSAGIACYPSHALEATELVARAARALSAARTDGHGRDHVAVAADD